MINRKRTAACGGTPTDEANPVPADGERPSSICARHARLQLRSCPTAHESEILFLGVAPDLLTSCSIRRDVYRRPGDQDNLFLGIPRDLLISCSIRSDVYRRR